MKTKLIEVCDPYELEIITKYDAEHPRNGTIGFHFKINPDNNESCKKAAEKFLKLNKCKEFYIYINKDSEKNYPVSKLKDIYDIYETILGGEESDYEFDMKEFE